jgi:8-oxo-dGTP pyrophosphatase MutT (NUDIX family)
MDHSPLDRVRLALGGRLQPRTTDQAVEQRYPGARRGAVLVLLYPYEREPHLVLTERTPHLSLHSGQISLPGGRVDPHDPSPLETALRETREELGIPTDQVEIWGVL